MPHHLSLPTRIAFTYTLSMSCLHDLYKYPVSNANLGRGFRKAANPVCEAMLPYCQAGFGLAALAHTDIADDSAWITFLEHSMEVGMPSSP